MECWLPPDAESAYLLRWQRLADRAAFDGSFTRAFTGSRRYAQLEAILLTQREHQLLWDASAALTAIFARVIEWVQRNPVLLSVLGIAPELERWVCHAPGASALALLARLDWVQDTTGHWWCLECNADTPGGLPEATVWQSLVAASTPNFIDPNQNLLPALSSALKEALPGIAGFVTAPGQIEDLENTLLAATTRANPYVLGGPPEITADGTLCVGGRPIDSLYRFYPGAWLTQHPTWLDQLSDGFPCANPGRSLIAQSKAFFALLWQLVESHQFLTSTEADWVRTFLPQTSLSPLAGEWVGKPYWAWEGAGVITGAGEGASDPGYIYQRRIQLAPLPTRIWTYEGARTLLAYPIIGVYLVAGAPSGYLSRVGGAITDRSAHMLPTLYRS